MSGSMECIYTWGYIHISIHLSGPQYCTNKQFPTPRAILLFTNTHATEHINEILKTNI